MHMKTLEKVIKDLKKEIEIEKTAETRDKKSKMLLKERNYYKANSMALMAKNDKLREKVEKLQDHNRNLEIDNHNLKRFFYKQKEKETVKEQKRQENNFELLDHVTKDSKRMKIMMSSEVGENKRITLKSSYNKGKLLIGEESKKLHLDNENNVKMNWKLFKKKDTFFEHMRKAQMKANAHVRGLTINIESGFTSVKDVATRTRATSFGIRSAKRDSYLQTPQHRQFSGTDKTQVSLQFKNRSIKVDRNNTISFLLNED